MDVTDRAGVQHGVDRAADEAVEPRSIGRRRFLGYVVSGATLLVAADLGLGATRGAAAALPTVPQPAELDRW